MFVQPFAFDRIRHSVSVTLKSTETNEMEYRMSTNFFQMSNDIFRYGLTPNELTVYCYLVSCAGQKDKCWPSVKTISKNCNITENTVRKCISVLVERGFIRRIHTTRYNRSGQSFQGNNNYYILDLPELPNKATVTA